MGRQRCWQLMEGFDPHIQSSGGPGSPSSGRASGLSPRSRNSSAFTASPHLQSPDLSPTSPSGLQGEGQPKLRESALELLQNEAELRKKAQEAAALPRLKREQKVVVPSPRAFVKPQTPKNLTQTPRGFEGIGEDGDDIDDSPEDPLGLTMQEWMADEQGRRLSDIQAAVALETERLNADRERVAKMGELRSSMENHLAEKRESLPKLVEPKPLPPMPALVKVPRWEGWVKKKGRSSMDLWRWRYVVLEHNFLQWWKRKEHFQGSQQPWGYLDFTTIPPHIAPDTKKEIRLEMPGRLYRLWCADAAEMEALWNALTAQEHNTRQRALDEQGTALMEDLAQSESTFHSHFAEALTREAEN